MVPDLPGQVIHIRMEGPSVMVIFEHVSWPFKISDITGAIEAFSNNDWRYFSSRWWQHHQFLRESSPTLNTLVSLIDDQELHSAQSLINLALKHGLYPSQHEPLFTRDSQRLSLIPQLNHWPREGFGMIVQDGHTPAIGWPGHLWREALLQYPHAQYLLPQMIENSLGTTA